MGAQRIRAKNRTLQDEHRVEDKGKTVGSGARTVSRAGVDRVAAARPSSLLQSLDNKPNRKMNAMFRMTSYNSR
jgi:hypothetical protein